MDDLPENLPSLSLRRQTGYELVGNVMEHNPARHLARHELFLRPVDPNLEMIQIPRRNLSPRRSVSPARRQLSPMRRLPALQRDLPESLPPLRIRSRSPVRRSPRRSPVRAAMAASPRRARSPIRHRSPHRSPIRHRSHSPMDVDSPLHRSPHRSRNPHQQPSPRRHMDVDRYYGKKCSY